MTKKNLISVKNLSFSYENSQKQALSNINLDVYEGEYIAILGTNGSGKSTLAKLIFGLLPLQEGIIEIEQTGNPIGFVQQNPKHQIIARIVEKDTAFGPELLKCSKEEVAKRTWNALNAVKLDDKIGEKTQSLSLGQTQKLAFAGILALKPDLFILDEALSMIDQQTSNSILDLLDDLHSKGKTIIHVTHEIEQAVRANRIVVIEKGSKIFDAGKEEFEKNEVLNKSIFGEKESSVYKRLELSKMKNISITSNSENKASILFENINFAYDKNPVLKNVNLTFYKGTVTAIIGKSGAGKSTLFELGCSLLPQTQGKIYCNGRTSLALQDAESALFEPVVADDVAFGPENRGITGKELREIVKNSMDICGVPFKEFKDRSILALSGGEKRKSALAGIIAMDADIIFFDEPTSSLDPKSREQFLSLVQKLADSGKTIIFSTHHLQDIQAADRVIQIEGGSVIQDSFQGGFIEQNKKDFGKSFNNFSFEKRSSGDSEEVKLKENLRYKEYESLLKNLRNASLGQYKKKKSFIHNINGLAKLILFLILLTGSVVSTNIVILTSFCFFSIIYSFLAKFSLKTIFMRSLKIIPWIIVFFIFQVLLFENREFDKLLWSWKFISITDAKLIGLLKMFLHFEGAMITISVFTFSMEQSELLESLKKFCHINVIVFIMLLLYFIPLLTEELSRIIKTQIIREGIKSTRGILKKIQALLPILIPLTIQTIKHSETLAEALEQRGMNF
ncbi:MAG: energy-coupling factor transporter ATPase [Treponemataceae bacterium]